MEEIRVETDPTGAVRTITINRPDKRNAISNAMFAELTRLFEEEPPATERVTVIRSVGHVFCSGIDLNERLVHGAPPLDTLCLRIRDYPLPVVAAVQGDAIAGGAFLALFCDFVIAAEDARVWVSLVQIGLAPPYPLTRHLSELGSLAQARKMVLLGDPISAKELAEARVIAEAVPADEHAAAVDRVVERLANNAPLSLRAIKATLNARAYEETPNDHIVAKIVKARDSEDGREGVKARLERRMPVYGGR